jgi:ankyrin repeat protein
VGELTDAVLRSDHAAMKRTIAAGGDLNEVSVGMTPLLFAVFRGDVEAVRLLLESGADPSMKPDRTSPLWHAEDDFGLLEIADLLKSYGARK